MTRPVSRPPHQPRVCYYVFHYQPGSWKRSRRVIARIARHAGEIFSRVGFLVTNLEWSPKKVVRFYNQRGKPEQWIKEGKQAMKWTKLSCGLFRDNQVRLQLFALAYKLGNFLRQSALLKAVEYWSLTNLREKLIKIGAKVVQKARYVTFQLAEVSVP